MITKTNLDGKLSQLEERLEKRIDIKVGQAVQKREHEIAKLKDDLKTLGEKIYEKGDINETLEDVDAKLIVEIEQLRARIEKLEKIIGAKPDSEIDEGAAKRSAGNKEADVITPDEM